MTARRTTSRRASSAKAAKSAGGKEVVYVGPYGSIDRTGRVTGVRRWNSANRTRLNRESWRSFTQNNTINQDLIDRRDLLVARSKWEAANNGFIRGMIETWVTDVVGDSGPSLQVQSDNPDFNEWLEQEWDAWWGRPDLNGQLTGPDFLDLDERSACEQGESINQIVEDPRSEHPWPMALVAIDSNRLSNSVLAGFQGVGKDNVVILGVERTRQGRVEAYWVNDTIDGVTISQTPRRIGAEQIIHLFEVIEADQARGVPRLAPILDVCAGLRSFDSETLTAARTAARFAALLESQGTAALEPVDMDASADINEGEWATVPPGWTIRQMQAQHPNTTYQMYSDERYREIGCAFGMPLMRLKLDSSKHNYSSARFDDQLYQRRVIKRRGVLSRNKLARLIAWMLRDRLRETVPVKVPKGGVQFLWSWQPFPHVDPLKEAQASLVRLASGTTTLADEIAVGGRDLESHIRVMARVYEAFDKAGVPIPEWGGTAMLLAQQIDSGEYAPGQNESNPSPPQRNAVVGSIGNTGGRKLTRSQINRIRTAAAEDARRSMQPVEFTQVVSWRKPKFARGAA